MSYETEAMYTAEAPAAATPAEAREAFTAAPPPSVTSAMDEALLGPFELYRSPFLTATLASLNSVALFVAPDGACANHC